jgi:hypothetical protein
VKNKLREMLIESISELFAKDYVLIKNGSSERSITHRLAIYLENRVNQSEFNGLNVDCEYNRNKDLGDGSAKSIKAKYDELTEELQEDYKERKQDEGFIILSTFPDIIIHKREENFQNKLIIELKPTKSGKSRELDELKLRCFTESEHNEYKFSYGVHIELDEDKSKTKLSWYENGTEICSEQLK